MHRLSKRARFGGEKKCICVHMHVGARRCFRGAFGGSRSSTYIGVRNRKSTGLYNRAIERFVLPFQVDLHVTPNVENFWWHDGIGACAHRRLAKFSPKSRRVTYPFPLFNQPKLLMKAVIIRQIDRSLILPVIRAK